LPLMVLLVIVIVPMLWIPPPLMSVRLPLRMVPVIVASPTLEIAPPKSPVAMLSARVLLMINPKKEPFTDPRVRKAIYLALDWQQIDDIVLDNTSGEPSIFMPGMAYDESEAVTWPGLRPKNTPGGQEDLAEAKRLMAEAGFADGFKTTYDARKVSFYVPICQVVKEQLKTALNITGDLQTWESAAGYKHYGTARAADAEGDWGLACQGEGMVVLDADAVFGGKTDLVIQRLVDTMMAFPAIIMALALMAALGASQKNVVVALVVILMPGAVRVIRSQVLSIKEQDYTLAAQAIGAGSTRIMLRHILPNVMATYIVLSTITLGYAIVVEASLSFLGVGIPPDVASWGGMLNLGATIYIEISPLLAVFPGVTIAVIVFAVNLLRDSLRDV